MEWSDDPTFRTLSGLDDLTHAPESLWSSLILLGFPLLLYTLVGFSLSRQFKWGFSSKGWLLKSFEQRSMSRAAARTTADCFSTSISLFFVAPVILCICFLLVLIHQDLEPYAVSLFLCWFFCVSVAWAFLRWRYRGWAFETFSGVCALLALSSLVAWGAYITYIEAESSFTSRSLFYFSLSAAAMFSSLRHDQVASLADSEAVLQADYTELQQRLASKVHAVIATYTSSATTNDTPTNENNSNSNNNNSSTSQTLPVSSSTPALPSSAYTDLSSAQAAAQSHFNALVRTALRSQLILAQSTGTKVAVWTWACSLVSLSTYVGVVVSSDSDNSVRALCIAACIIFYDIMISVYIHARAAKSSSSSSTDPDIGLGARSDAADAAVPGVPDADEVVGGDIEEEEEEEVGGTGGSGYGLDKMGSLMREPSLSMQPSLQWQASVSTANTNTLRNAPGSSSNSNHNPGPRSRPQPHAPRQRQRQPKSHPSRTRTSADMLDLLRTPGTSTSALLTNPYIQLLLLVVPRIFLACIRPWPEAVCLMYGLFVFGVVIVDLLMKYPRHTLHDVYLRRKLSDVADELRAYVSSVMHTVGTFIIMTFFVIFLFCFIS